MLRWRLAVVAALALLLLATAGTAAAAPLSVKAVTSTLRGQRVFVQPAVTPKPDVAALRTLARQPENRGWRFVILDVPLRGTSTAQQSAAAIVEEFGTVKVTIVVVVKKLGAASSQYPADRVAAAVTTANQAGAGTDPVALSQAFASALVQPGEPPAGSGAGAGTDAEGGTGAQGGAEGAADEGDDGRPWWQWALAGLVVLAAVLFVLTRLRSRSRDRRKRRRGGSIGTSRDFHLDRLERLARRHAELVRPIAERGGIEDPELQQHYETAGGKLVALRRSIPQLASPRELRTAASELDEIEWHVESAESLVAGRPTPPKPLRDRPALCFFTHEHGLATEEIDLVRPDGTITAVRVCPANARALERGEMPAVSAVHVGGREIPWPAAPTWYGAPGWTLDDLPGTEYQGREIWGRDMPRREEPLPDGEGEPEAEAAAEDVEDEGLPPGVRVPDEDLPAPARDDADAVALGPGLLDPDDLAAIEGQERAADDAAGEPPPVDDEAPAEAGEPAEPADDVAPEPAPDEAAATAAERGRARGAAEGGTDETVAFDPFGGSEDLAPWERDEDAPPRGG